MKRKTKRIIGILLSLVLILGMIPGVAMTGLAASYSADANSISVDAGGNVTVKFTVTEVSGSQVLYGFGLCLFDAQPTVGSGGKISGSNDIHFNSDQCKHTYTQMLAAPISDLNGNQQYTLTFGADSVDKTSQDEGSGTVDNLIVSRDGGKTLSSALEEDKTWYVVIGPITTYNGQPYTNCDVYVGESNEVLVPKYTVTFDANGHGTAPTSQVKALGSTATEPSAPTAAGYTFDGWYKEAACENQWNFGSDTVTADTTLYAKWESNFVEVSNFSELQNAIENGKSVKLISDIECDSEITISGAKQIIIDGNDKSLTSDGQEHRAFTVSSGSVLAIKDTTISGFNNSDDGGAILNQGTLVLDSCTLNNNNTSADNKNGGAIENEGMLYANSTTFEGNNSKGKGGAINNSDDSSLYINDCTFTDNCTQSSDAKDGGAISNSSSGEVRIINSTFSGNKYDTNAASSDLGFVTTPDNYTIAGCQDITINSTSTLTTYSEGTAELNYDNLSDILFTCTYDYENVWNFEQLLSAIKEGKNVKVMDDITCNNEINIPDGKQITIDGNKKSLTSNGDTHRAFNIKNSSVLVIKNTTISDFQAKNGGAIDSSGTLVLDNCKLTNNKATTSGGGAIENKGKLYATGTTFESNSSGEVGGAINNYSGSLYMGDCTFKNNYTTRSEAKFGGAIGNNSSGEVRIINSTFSGNKYDTTTASSDFGVYDRPGEYTIAGCSGITIQPTGELTTYDKGTSQLDYSNLSNIKFNYTYENSRSGGGGGYTPTPTPSHEDYSAPISNEGSMNINADISKGTATISEITAEDIAEVTRKPEGESASGDKSITIDVSGAKQTVTEVVLTTDTMDNLATAVNESDDIESVTIVMTNSKVELDSAAAASIAAQAEGDDIRLVVADKNKIKLQETQKQALSQFTESRPFEAFFESGGKRIHDFNGGNVTISLKFEPKSGRDINYYHVYYVAIDDTLTKMRTWFEDGHLYFKTSHFSDYAIVYDEKEINDTLPDGITRNDDGTLTYSDPDLGDAIIAEEVIMEGMIYRMYNPNTGEHTFTKNIAEVNSNVKDGWNHEEDSDFPTYGYDTDGSLPVYRLYNPVTGLHHYTMARNEAVWLVKDHNFNFEGIVFFALPANNEQGSQIYRLYNPFDYQHLFTISGGENDVRGSEGWQKEGVAFNVK